MRENPPPESWDFSPPPVLGWLDEIALSAITTHRRQSVASHKMALALSALSALALQIGAGRLNVVGTNVQVGVQLLAHSYAHHWSPSHVSDWSRCPSMRR